MIAKLKYSPNRLFAIVFLVLITFTIAVQGRKYPLDKSSSNEDFLEADISQYGLKAPLYEYDEIPREPNSDSKIKQTCKIQLQSHYEDAIAALTSDMKTCKLTSIAADFIHPKYIQGIHQGKIYTGNDNIEISSDCKRIEFAARCSAYLKFANCMYLRHVGGAAGNNKDLVISDGVKEFFTEKYDKTLISIYTNRSGGRIGFLMHEALGYMCRYVNNACMDIHPQFDHNVDHRLSQACSIFDYITPLNSYESLFTLENDSEELEILVYKDKDLISNYNNIQLSKLMYTSMGIPLDTPVNSQHKIETYLQTLCNQRCEVVQKLMVSRD
ncbi:hypothetical protein BdWA1_002701 [Babesia duncani]|uniref:Uncharacterized protein n=1 Tax=Babesia duncani TaxID=323732 RepID=A0AAD9PK93_9APIC|nr:hypothetical protein BdWA1_002701 [Babesia duncani]